MREVTRTTTDRNSWKASVEALCSAAEENELDDDNDDDDSLLYL